jgi:hypothetical protein
VLNLIDIGEQKLLSSSLETFNKKLTCIKAGNLEGMAGMIEKDELLSVQLTIDLDNT